MGRIFGLAAVIFLSACSGRVRSVRALRQHIREPARVEVVRARVADFRASLKTINALLVGPGYVPGSLVDRLRLDEKQAHRIRAELEATGVYRDDSFRVPIAAIYGRHLEGIELGATQTKSLLEVADTMFGDGRSLMMAWQEVGRARAALVKAERRLYTLKDELNTSMSNASKQEQEQFRAGIKGAAYFRNMREQKAEQANALLRKASAQLKVHSRTEAARAVANDLSAVLSMAARLSAEVAATAPVVTRHAYSVMNKTRGPERAKMLELALELHAMDADSSVASAGLLAMADQVANAAGMSLERTPGYLFRESASDAVLGFAPDSLYATVRVGTEVMFFSHSQADDASGFDTSTQTRRLDYDVESIVFAEVSVDAGLDLLSLPGILELSLGYKTDRVYGSGGSIERSGDALAALGADTAASDVLSAGLALVGVRAQVETARFNQGRARLIDVQSDTVIDTSPLILERLKVDFTYDVLRLLDEPAASGLDGLDVGLRYMRYALPRIVYRWKDRDGDPDTDRYEVITESDPQVVVTEAYQGGVLARGAWDISAHWHIPLAVGLYFGLGPTAYAPTSGADTQTNLFGVFTFPFLAGVAYSFTSPRSDLRVDFELLYRLEVIGITSANDLGEDDEDTSDLGSTKRTFGGTDLFHGPTAQLMIGF